MLALTTEIVSFSDNPAVIAVGFNTVLLAKQFRKLAPYFTADDCTCHWTPAENGCLCNGTGGAWYVPEPPERKSVAEAATFKQA